MAVQHPQNGAVGEGGRELLALRAGDPEQNLQAAVYAALWAGLLITPASSLHWDDNLGGFLTLFAKHFSEDAWIVERHLLPLYDAFVNATPHPPPRPPPPPPPATAAGRGRGPGPAAPRRENVREALAIARNLDARCPAAQRRYTQDIRDAVRHRVARCSGTAATDTSPSSTAGQSAGSRRCPRPTPCPCRRRWTRSRTRRGGAHQSRQAPGAGAGTARRWRQAGLLYVPVRPIFPPSLLRTT